MVQPPAPPSTRNGGVYLELVQLEAHLSYLSRGKILVRVQGSGIIKKETQWP